MGIDTLFGLQNKVAIVTGGGRGLGLAISHALAEAGSDIVICSRKEANCKKAARDMARLGANAIGYKCDITDRDNIVSLKDFVLKEFGKIDILVNNSGATWGASTEHYPLDGWNKVINVNVTGTFLCSQIIGGQMIEEGGGKIINVSSITGSVGCKSELMDAIAYNTSKGAVDAFTRDLAVKWAKHHINVNAIAPAFFKTDLTSATMDKSGDHILNHVPMGRFGELSDLKGSIIFLASSASDYITGIILYIDGGYRAM
jgi:NAD(P)-dependent dehydrogenase (short-subunit alcohol dehydrogenase family)